MIGRRGFLAGLIALADAPKLVKAAAPAEIVVDVSHQSGAAITVKPLYGGLQVGDIITIEGVFSNKHPDMLRQFVVTSAAEPGDRVISLYPSLISEHPQERYATVKKLPMRGARINVVGDRLIYDKERRTVVPAFSRGEHDVRT